MFVIILALLIAMGISSFIGATVRLLLSPIGGVVALFAGVWATSNLAIAFAVTVAVFIAVCLFRPAAWLAAALWGLCLGFVPFAFLTIVGLPVPLAALAMPLTAWLLVVRSNELAAA